MDLSFSASAPSSSLCISTIPHCSTSQLHKNPVRPTCKSALFCSLKTSLQNPFPTSFNASPFPSISGRPISPKLQIRTPKRRHSARFAIWGFILLSVQAHVHQLRPPHCNMVAEGQQCTEASGFKALIFFVALYLVAIGSGCLKPNIISHGADQFRKDDPEQSKNLSSYFNTAYFSSQSSCVGPNMIRDGCRVWSSAAAMTVGLISLIAGTLVYRNKPPQGSIFTPIAQEFSGSSIKMRDTGGGNEDQLALISPENEGKNINFPGAMRTPVAKLLKKVEKGNTGSIADIPKHSKKVTRHEYEVETSNGRTITKRRKTKNTVMFGDPAMHKKAKNFKTPNVRKSQKIIDFRDVFFHPISND